MTLQDYKIHDTMIQWFWIKYIYSTNRDLKFKLRQIIISENRNFK